MQADAPPPAAASSAALSTSAGATALAEVPAGALSTAGAGALADAPPPASPPAKSSAIIVPVVGVRSPTAIVADTRATATLAAMPADFPRGLFPDWDDTKKGVVNSVRQWAWDPNNASGGTFGIKSNGTGTSACTKHGEIRRIQCVCAGLGTKKGTGCPWQVQYEQYQNSIDGSVGFVLLNGRFEHNHHLETTQVERLAAGSHVPEKYEEMATKMAQGGQTADEINKTLTVLAGIDGERVEWTYDYIYDNYVKPNKVTKVLDMTKVTEFLRQRVPAVPPCHMRACAPIYVH